MSWLTAFFVKLFANWTMVEFCRGVIINVFSTIVMGESGKLLSKIKCGKEDEEVVRKCLYKAISKNVVNEDIAHYIQIHDNDKFISALKNELISNEHVFASGSNDAKILDSFQKELSKKPFFTIKLIKLYGQEICSKENETLDRLNEQIREIQKIKAQSESIIAAVQTLTARTGYELNISDSVSGTFDCPIPDVSFSRSSLSAKIGVILKNKGSIYLYGGYKTGKSILSCMVAKEMVDFQKVRIPLDYRNILSIKDIVNKYDTGDKILFVIDGIPYQEESIILDLCNFIQSQNKNYWLFLLNGRHALSEFTTTNLPIEEMLVPQLDEKEIKTAVPTQSKSLVHAISTLSEGNPLVAILMIQMLSQKGWPNNADALYALFGFSANTSLHDKFRNILKQIIPNRESIRLLNRLLLFKRPFSREESRQIASMDPVISLPDSCFDDLKNVAIADKGDGKYVVIPSFSKTLEPDLLRPERFLCDNWLANQIVSKKTLSELDVMRAFSYMIDGGDYDRAGVFYISCLSNIKSQDLSESILSGIWIDLDLPSGMSIDLKVLIRIQQIIVFGLEEGNDKTYPAFDLERLIKKESIEPNLLRFSYQVLYLYYGIQGEVEKALGYLDLMKTIPAKKELALELGESLWMTLYKVSTEEELYAWFETYEKEGYPAYDFKEEMCNRAVSNIFAEGKEVGVEQRLVTIKQRAEEKSEQLKPFAICAEANLIFYYGINNLCTQAEETYNQSKYLNDAFGNLLLNYALGVCYYKNNDKVKSSDYFKKVFEVEKIEINAINVLYAYVYYAAIQIETNPQESVDALEKLLKHPNFEKCFVESERALLYGELAIAYWENDNKPESIGCMQKVHSYVWSNRDDLNDDQKVLLVRLSVLVTHYYGLQQGPSFDNSNYAVPKSSMFILVNGQLKEEYSDFRLLATTFYLYELQREFLWNSGFTLTLLEHSMSLYKGSVITTQPQYATLFLNCIPELLLNDRLDDVSYIIIQSARSVKNYSEIIKNPENAVLVCSLLYLLLYRLNKKITKDQFDESTLISILEDFKSIYPQNSYFSSYLLNVMEKGDKIDYHYSNDPSVQTVLVFYNLLEETSTNFWFVALQRLYVTMQKLNKSKACGKFVEIVTTNLLEYSLNTYPSGFHQDGKMKVLQGLQKYSSFERSRAVLSGFYFLMKNAPSLSSEDEKLIYM